MDDILNQIEETEFDNFEGLVEGMSDEEFLGAIRRNPRRYRKAIVRRHKTRNVGAMTPPKSEKTASRAEFESRFNLLSKDLKAGLRSKQLQLVDSKIYTVKTISEVNRALIFEDDDQKAIGVRNISQGKLPKDEVFLLSAIQVLYGVGTGKNETQTDVATVTEWTEIPALLQSGEFNLTANRKSLIDAMPMSVFANHSHSAGIIKNDAGSENVGGFGYATGEGAPGYFKLANPKLIETQTSIEMPMEWAAAAAEYAFVKVIFHGTKVTKY